MNDTERRYYERGVRVNQFGIENAGDFTGKATTLFAEIATLVGDTESEAAKQQSGFGEAGQQFEIKDTARELVRDIMSDISRTSKSMEYEFDGISDKFLFRRNLNDASLLAKARAFHSESAAYEADFIAYEMDPDFRKDLNDAANDFEASFSSTASATAEHVSATAETASKLRQMNVAVRTLARFGENKYANNPGTVVSFGTTLADLYRQNRAAWLSASHVEKAPKKKETPTP